MDPDEVARLREVVTQMAAENTLLPDGLRGGVVVGKFIPINKKNYDKIDITAEDAILDSPSQAVPLLIKKPDIWPPRLTNTDDSAKKRVRFSEQKDQESADEDAEKPDDEPADSTADEAADQPEAGNEKAEADEAAAAKASTMLTIPDYYKSSVGNLLLGIGLSRATEWFHRDAIKQLHKAIHKEGELDEYVEEMKKQQAMYQQCKAANSIFVFPAKKCPICEFRTDSDVGLEQHLSVPHLSNKREYKCNYCTFSTRDPRTTLFHFQTVHNKQCTIEPPAQLYECPVCPYESSQKQKAAAHIAKCLKFFNPEKVQAVSDPEAEYPAITPKPITQTDIRTYESTLATLRIVAQTPGAQMPDIPGLPKGLQTQMLLLTQQQLAQAARERPKNRGAQLPANRSSPGAAGFGNKMSNNSHPPAATSNSAAPQLYQMLQQGGPGGHTQLVPVTKGQSGLDLSSGNRNRLSIPGNRNSSPQVARGLSAAQSQGANKIDAGKGTFVICEICDGYIKDLEQLRTHMQWIHKVKIHPKMLASRPPLNCQRCQWRFFTDQGLERHLLGAHGLVTSNMQDMVNQSNDGGRCTVCGRIFANKLVAHMNQVHKITLKPAHLSYKCTVCSATFNLYRLFESHVYMVHSGSVKRPAAGDGEQSLIKKPRRDLENSPANNGEAIWYVLTHVSRVFSYNSDPIPALSRRDGRGRRRDISDDEGEKSDDADDSEWLPDWRIDLQVAEEEDGRKVCRKCKMAVEVADYPAHIRTHVLDHEVPICPIDQCSRFLKENEGLIIRTDRRSDVVSDPAEIGDEDDDSLDGEDMITALNSDYKKNAVTFYTHPGTKLHDETMYRLPNFRSFL